MKLQFVIISMLVLLSGAEAVAQGKGVYSIVPAQSKLEINVYKEGLFKAFGHNHLITAKQISGDLRIEDLQNKGIENSTVSLQVETGSLMVQPEGESEKDRPEIQATMIGEKVLDAAKYPKIRFTSTGVSAVKPAADGYTLLLVGNLNLHGVEKSVQIPVRLHVQNNQLEAQGEVSLLQTDYGITPVKVGGGAVTVKNQLKISFDIVALATSE